MESVWRKTSCHRDEIAPSSAYDLLDADTGKIIQSLQNDGEAITIAGGFIGKIGLFTTEIKFKIKLFIAFSLGLTNQYTDIDIFVHPLSFNILIKKLMDVNLTVRFHQVTPEDYPERDMEVWDVYEQNGSKKTSLQIIVMMRSWVYSMLSHRIGTCGELPKPDGLLFSKCLLRDFDLTICRCALYQGTYIQR